MSHEMAIAGFYLLVGATYCSKFLRRGLRNGDKYDLMLSAIYLAAATTNGLFICRML